MARVGNCTTPEDARALVCHYIGNCLLGIAGLYERLEYEHDQEQRGRIEDSIGRQEMELVGALDILAYRMGSLEHTEMAERIDELLEVVLESGTTESHARTAIHNKYMELFEAV